MPVAGISGASAGKTARVADLGGSPAWATGEPGTRDPGTRDPGTRDCQRYVRNAHARAGCRMSRMRAHTGPRNRRRRPRTIQTWTADLVAPRASRSRIPGAPRGRMPATAVGHVRNGHQQSTRRPCRMRPAAGACVRPPATTSRRACRAHWPGASGGASGRRRARAPVRRRPQRCSERATWPR